MEVQCEKLGLLLRQPVIQDFDVELLLEIVAVLPHETAVEHGLEVSSRDGVASAEQRRDVHGGASVGAEAALNWHRQRAS